MDAERGGPGGLRTYSALAWKSTSGPGQEARQTRPWERYRGHYQPTVADCIRPLAVSLRRLDARLTRSPSTPAFSASRSRNCRHPRACITNPKTGFVPRLHWAYSHRPSLIRAFRRIRSRLPTSGSSLLVPVHGGCAYPCRRRRRHALATEPREVGVALEIPSSVATTDAEWPDSIRVMIIQRP